jgi:hypothetical protein
MDQGNVGGPLHCAGICVEDEERMQGWWKSAATAAAALLVVCAPAAEVRREGTVPARGVRTVRITAAGAVTIRGAETANVAWTAISRAGDGRVESRRTAQALSLAFPDAEVTVTVPRDVRLCWVRTTAGSVQAWDLGGAVEVTSDGGQLGLDRISGPVTARTVGGAIHIGNVASDARCFTGAGGIRAERIGGRATLETAGGEISVQEARGALAASSAGGNIEIARADSSISARTSGGLIRIGQAAGPVIADTGGGAIQIAASGGAVCQASRGGIQLKNVAGMVRAISGSGDILAELLAGARLQNSQLSTNSGDITVLIPASLALTVMARSVVNGGVGRIVSDFPEIRTSAPGGRAETAEGSLNGGGAVLQVVASGGAVYLRRRQQ